MRLLVIASSMLLASNVFAGSVFEQLDNFYVGAGAAYIDGNTNDASGNDISFNAVEFVGGYKYSGLLSADARLGFGLSDREITLADDSIADSSIDYYASLYWRPETANEVAKIYGLVGFSTVSVSIDDDSDSDTGFSYGGGVGFVLKEDWNLNFEYREILDNDDNEFSVVSFNVDYRF